MAEFKFTLPYTAADISTKLGKIDTLYPDTIRYTVTQNLSSEDKANARNNIDVYSKTEIDAIIAAAIGNAIGGSY